MANSLKTLTTALDGNGRSTCCGSWIIDGECFACFEKQERNERINGRFVMVVRTVGNPDFGQYAAITDPTLLSADAIEGLREAAHKHQSAFQIGGGNWTNPEVKLNGKRVGFMSYNGRIWDKKKAWEGDATQVTTF